MSRVIGVGDEALNLLLLQFLGEGRKEQWIFITVLQRCVFLMDGVAIQSRRRSCFEASQGESQ